MQQNRLFDLNIEQVLEHWEPEHAVREIISLFKIEVAYLYSYKFTYSPTINGIPNTNENTHFPTKLQILI